MGVWPRESKNWNLKEICSIGSKIYVAWMTDDGQISFSWALQAWLKIETHYGTQLHNQTMHRRFSWVRKEEHMPLGEEPVLIFILKRTCRSGIGLQILFFSSMSCLQPDLIYSITIGNVGKWNRKAVIAAMLHVYENLQMVSVTK